MMLEFCIALSMHFGIGAGWNEVHPCVRVTEANWTVGAYLNSENRVSHYVSYTFENVFWVVDLEMGAATGYSGAPVVPYGRALLAISDKTRLFVAPAYRVGKRKIGLVAGIEYTF